MVSLGQFASGDALDRRTLAPEANPGDPLRGELERMAKRRFQNPKPFREGNWWWINPWIDGYEEGRLVRKRKRMKLAEASMPATEAKKLAADMLRPMNRGAETIGSATPFSVYVNTTYRNAVLPRLASTTRSNYDYLTAKHLVPVFGDSPLRDLTPATLQTYFNRLEGSSASITKIKDALGSILASAVQYELLEKNPLARVHLTRAVKPKQPHITPEQFDSLVNIMAEPYATMVYVCVLAGLRVSELIGLKWEDVHADSITIDERYCRGDWGCTKTTASSATIGVDSSVVQRIQQLKNAEVTINWGAHGAKKKFKLVRSSDPQDLVFQSLRTGAPMSDHNILSRHIKPAACKLRIGWVNWQALRRSCATWLVQAGADVKSVQGQMRHSRVQTTMQIYAQIVPESQRRAVAKMSGMVAERIAKAREAASATIN